MVYKATFTSLGGHHLVPPTIASMAASLLSGSRPRDSRGAEALTNKFLDFKTCWWVVDFQGIYHDISNYYSYDSWGLYANTHWLVNWWGVEPPHWKNMKVSWDDYSQYLENKKTNHQRKWIWVKIRYPLIWMILPGIDIKHLWFHVPHFLYPSPE